MFQKLVFRVLPGFYCFLFFVFIVFECFKTPVKHEARVSESAFESALNCKEKKTKESKNHISM